MKIKSEIQMKNEVQKKINQLLQNLEDELYGNDFHTDLFVELSENKKRITICLK